MVIPPGRLRCQPSPSKITTAGALAHITCINPDQLSVLQISSPTGLFWGLFEIIPPEQSGCYPTLRCPPDFDGFVVRSGQQHLPDRVVVDVADHASVTLEPLHNTAGWSSSLNITILCQGGAGRSQKKAENETQKRGRQVRERAKGDPILLHVRVERKVVRTVFWVLSAGEAGSGVGYPTICS